MIVTFDTETSKTDRYDELGHCYNEIVCYTMSTYTVDGEEIESYLYRYPHEVYGKIQDLAAFGNIVCFVHNLGYDWQFCKQELTDAGFTLVPEKTLWMSAHDPLYISYLCPDHTHIVEFRDSLKMFNTSLANVCKQYNPPHGKLCGEWEYLKRRTRETVLTPEEIGYALNDTRALAESIAIYMKSLKDNYNIFNKTNIVTLPRTSTGVPRALAKHALKSDRTWWTRFKDIQPADINLQNLLHDTFQGGYTHASWKTLGKIIKGNVTCYDFSSSYPTRMIMNKFPMSSLTQLKQHITMRTIYRWVKDDGMGFIGTITLLNPRIKSTSPMCYLSANPKKAYIDGEYLVDNGRVYQCKGLYSTKVTNIDVEIILDTYDFDNMVITDVYYFMMDYLPENFRNLILELYQDKTDRKSSSPVLYMLSKAILNACYGMCVQDPCKSSISYVDGEFYEEEYDEEQYVKWHDRGNTPLPYIWGVYITAYARKELFNLGKCIADDGEWLYSDTDSIFVTKIDKEKLDSYNDSIRTRMLEAGVKPIRNRADENDTKEYVLGVAELDKECTEFITLGAKKYAYRDKKGDLHITVSGVPKCGVAELQDDIRNFKKGLVFRGSVTGKKTHTYIESPTPCIDIVECDYLLDDCHLRKMI